MMNQVEESGIRGIVHQYVRAQAKRGTVSTTKAVRALRTAVPGCRMSDRELADLVAEQAVTAGFAIDFDMGNRTTSA